MSFEKLSLLTELNFILSYISTKRRITFLRLNTDQEARVGLKKKNMISKGILSWCTKTF